VGRSVHGVHVAAGGVGGGDGGGGIVRGIARSSGVPGTRLGQRGGQRGNAGGGHGGGNAGSMPPTFPAFPGRDAAAVVGGSGDSGEGPLYGVLRRRTAAQRGAAAAQRGVSSGASWSDWFPPLPGLTDVSMGDSLGDAIRNGPSPGSALEFRWDEDVGAGGAEMAADNVDFGGASNLGVGAGTQIVVPEALVAAVQDVMPHASNEVVLSDLASTGSAEETITNLLEGRAASAGRIVNGRRCVVVNGRSVVLGRSAEGSRYEGGVGGVVGGMSHGGMSRGDVGGGGGGSAEVLPSVVPSRGVTTTAEGAGGGGSGAAKGGDTDTAPPTVSSSGLVSGLPPFPGSPILRNTHGTIPGHAAPPPITFLPDTVGVVGGWQPPWDRVAARASEEGNTTDNEVKEECVNDDEHGAKEGNVAKADHVKDAKTWSFPNSPAFSSDASSGVSSTSQIIHAARTTPCAQAGSSSDAASDYRTTNGASNDATTDDATTRRLRALDAAERRRCDAM
jgi:hypothetical protein